MTSGIGGIQAEGVAADIAGVAEAHGLSPSARARLLRFVTGTLPGNRDRPVFLLAARLCEAGREDPLYLLLPGQTALRRFDAAFLDFLMTVAVGDPDEFEEFMVAFEAALRKEDPVRQLTSTLARVLHRYRARMLPEERHHNLFNAIRMFYARYRPEDPTPRDGDALDFWETEATRAFLARYVTALNGLADFADAARLAATWGVGIALDDAEPRDLPEDAGADTAEGDQLAPELLESSLAALDAAPVKLLLARELEEMGALAGIAGAVRRWPLGTLPALGFGPIQNAITEALRRGGTAPDLAAHMARAESYAELRARYEHLSEKLMDALHVVHLCGLSEAEKASARSSLSAERRKRVEAVQRRKSLTQMDETVRGPALLALVEPLLVLRALVEAGCAAWATLSAERMSEVQQDHGERFRAKLEALYAPREEEGEAG